MIDIWLGGCVAGFFSFERFSHYNLLLKSFDAGLLWFMRLNIEYTIHMTRALTNPKKQINDLKTEWHD